MALSLIFSLSLIYPTATITQDIQETKSNTTEKWLSRVYAAIWAGTAITETLSLAFAPINCLLYGNTPASETSKKIVFDVINATKLSHPLDIKASRSFWTSLGENAFSHQGTLFINPTIFNDPNFAMSDSLKKEIVSATVAMNNNYDSKILGASIVVPVAVWATLYCADKLLKKLNTPQQSPWIQKASELVDRYKKSFYFKAGTSLAIIAAYILYQKSLITSATNILLS